jgi:hypothetical protein
MKMLASVLLAALVPLASLASGCNKPPEPQPEKPAASAAASVSSAMAMPAMPAGHPPVTGSGSIAAGSSGVAAPAGPEDLAYDVPSTWVSAPNPSPMRKATFKVPKAGGDTEDAELAVSAAGGGVEPNIKRWEQQFGDAKAKTEPRNPNGLKVTVVEIKGSVAAGGMMGMPAAAAKEHQMLLGAVVDAGDRQHFFKMVGGEKTVTAAKKDFDKFVASLRAK